MAFPVKGGSSVRISPSSTPKSPQWVLGSRPAALRAEPLSRPRIKPDAASTRDYTKGQPAPFSTMGKQPGGLL